MFIHGEVQLELAEINVRHLCIIEIIDINSKCLATMVSLRRIPGKLDQSRKMRTWQKVWQCRGSPGKRAESKKTLGCEEQEACEQEFHAIVNESSLPACNFFILPNQHTTSSVQPLAGVAIIHYSKKTLMTRCQILCTMRLQCVSKILTPRRMLQKTWLIAQINLWNNSFQNM